MTEIIIISSFVAVWAIVLILLFRTELENRKAGIVFASLFLGIITHWFTFTLVPILLQAIIKMLPTVGGAILFLFAVGLLLSIPAIAVVLVGYWMEKNK